MATEPLSCSYCDYWATRLDALQLHVKLAHRDDPETLSCPDCDYKTTQKTILSKHRLKDCGNREAYKNSLENYLYSQRERKGKRKIMYSQNMTLSSSFHEGQSSRFSCNSCKFTANSNYRLKEHINSMHRGIKFSCPLCDFKGNRADYLVSHQNVMHRGIKFPCPECDYRASTARKLKIHINYKHKGIKFQCPDCDFSAPRKFDIQRHTKRKHMD